MAPKSEIILVEKIARSQVGDFGSFLWLFGARKSAIPRLEAAVSQGPSSVQHFRSLPREKDPLFFRKSSKILFNLSQKISRNWQLF